MLKKESLPPTSVGIFDIAIYLPNSNIQIETISEQLNTPVEVLFEKTRFKEKPQASINEHSIAMATQVVKDLLLKHNLPSSTINFIIFCHAAAEYAFWSPSAYIQELIGAVNAYSINISNGCSSGILGIEICRNFLLNNQMATYGLVVISDTLSKFVDYTQLENASLFNFSDGAAAILLKNNYHDNNVLGFSGKTHARFYNHLSFLASTQKIQITNSDKDIKKGIAKIYSILYPKTIRSALRKNGIKAKEVQYVFINQGDSQLLTTIANNTSIPLAKFHKSIERYGHMGGADPFLGFVQLQKENLFKKGDVIVLASSSFGFSWNALVIKV